MPPPPITEAKRARAGLSGVPITHQESTAVKAEREARALVALLPYGSTPFGPTSSTVMNLAGLYGDITT